MSCIVAIDPGPKESAFVRYDPLCQELLDFGKEPNGKFIGEGWEPFKGDSIFIEMIASYGMPVGKEVFETCVFIGKLLNTYQWEWNTHRLTRHMVKLHVCKSARANDANIRAALIDRFGGTPAIKKGGPLYKVSGDVWAALAVAITAAETTERYEP